MSADQRDDTSVKCKWCDATVADSSDAALAATRWGWTLAPDFGGLGFWYACPECSDDNMKDAFVSARHAQGAKGNKR